mmetsp:Transcript_30243/g.66501  ORF Transcript_30243/g.66501 Transcript_30243/m.66501 type:complete len:83 (-) Transcript_30243:65-313(-)
MHGRRKRKFIAATAAVRDDINTTILIVISYAFFSFGTTDQRILSHKILVCRTREKTETTRSLRTLQLDNGYGTFSGQAKLHI